VREVVAASLLLCAVVVGCQYPRDPEGTLDRVEGGTMRVGVIDNPPWVDLSGAMPSGVEVELIERFAEELDAEIVWVEGPESDLVEAMRGFQLDVIIGGLTRSSLYRKHVALTRPYLDTEIQFGVPPAEELPDDLDGVEIWVEEHSEPASLLKQEEEDAIPVFFDRLGEIEGPTLLDTYDIDAIGYERTSNILRDDEHAMATPMGENAFLVELENFLLDRGEEAGEILARESAR
jgi:polar amino acid transport system substrate-binding protein